ncbi:MAG: hypothetical protein RIT81_42225 [Deltaproteobacteria bacterium]
MMRALLVLVLVFAACGDAGSLRAPERGPEQARPVGPEFPNLDEAESRGGAPEPSRQVLDLETEVLTPEGVCRELCSLSQQCGGVVTNCVPDCVEDIGPQSMACQGALLRFARCFFRACPETPMDPDSCISPQDAEILRRC